MTRTLPSGLEVKTGWLPDQFATDADWSHRHYVEIENDPEVSMAEAVDALRIAFQDPELAKDALFLEFRRWIKSFYPKTLGEKDGILRPRERLIPALQDVDIELPLDDSGPTVEVLGHQLTRNDLIEFTEYLLMNSEPEGPEDPRIVFLDELRGDGEQPKREDGPLYKMIIDGKEHWLPLNRAGIAYDSGWVPVEIGGRVLEGVGLTRSITAEERRKIADIADEYSASK